MKGIIRQLLLGHRIVQKAAIARISSRGTLNFIIIIIIILIIIIIIIGTPDQGVLIIMT